jgi:DNA-binding CsgD family transcriptional regulator
MTDAAVETITTALRAGASVGVVGEAGAGTTHLVRQVISALDGSACTGGLRTLSDRPLLAFRRLLRDLGSQDPSRVAEQVVAHLDAAGAEVLVVEDLQWLDDASVEVLEHLRGRIPLLVTERPPAALIARLAPTDVVRVDPLSTSEAESMLRELDVPEERIASLVITGSGHPARLRELATGSSSALLAADLAAPLLGAAATTRRRAAWLAHAEGAERSDPAATDELRELAELGLVSRGGHGTVLRFAELGELAERSLDDDERRALHLELAEHWSHDPVRAARHLGAAGRPTEAAAAAATALALGDGGPTDAERIELYELVATGAPSGRQAQAWLHAAAAAVDDAEYELALQHLAAANADDAAITGDPLAREVQAAALAGLGRPGDAVALLGEPLDGGAADVDGLRDLVAQLLAWPMLRLDKAERCDAAHHFVDEVAAIVGIGPASAAGTATGSSKSSTPGASTAESSSSLAVIAACVPGRVASARSQLARGVPRHRLDWAERAAAEQVVELVTLGSCVAATTELERWCSDPVLRRHEASLSAHLALATADTGATGDALARLAALPPAQTTPDGHAALLGWARAEIELAAGRPRRAATAARAAMSAAPAGSVLHDLAAVTAAWTAELGVATPTAPPRHAAAAHEVRGVVHLVAEDWSTARTELLDAAQGWSGVLRRSELRCRWAAAEAGRHAGVATAIDELHEVERLADELGQRSLVARARASLRDAGVRRAPRRGGHPSGLTLREVEVLERVAEGRTSGEIGQQLGIARSTVDTLADSARRKLGAKNRRHAALLLSELR